LLKQGRERDYLNWINNNQVLICELVSNYGLSGVIYILATDDKNEPSDLINAIIQAAPNQKETIMTAAHKLQEEAKREGIQEGIQTGAYKRY